MSKRFLILTGVILLIVAIGVTSYRMYNKPHRNIAKENAAFEMTASDLLNAFQADEEAANAKYLNQVVSVSGTIISLDLNSQGNRQLILVDEMEGVSAHFDDAYVKENKELFNTLNSGSMVKLKGTCDGYLMLRGVVLNHCALIP